MYLIIYNISTVFEEISPSVTRRGRHHFADRDHCRIQRQIVIVITTTVAITVIAVVIVIIVLVAVVRRRVVI